MCAERRLLPSTAGTQVGKHTNTLKAPNDESVFDKDVLQKFIYRKNDEVQS